MQTYSQLIGAYKTEEQICRSIGADSLKYLSVKHLVQSCKDCNLGFCLGCFNGKYPYEMDSMETDKLKLE